MKSRIIEISTGNHADSIILPINPEKISISMSQKNQTLDLLELGEVLSLGNRGLASFSFSSFFPSAKTPLYRYADRGPWDYFNALDRWRLAKTVVRVIIGGSGINMATAIEKLEPELHEGDDDLYYKVEFKEYRRLNVPLQQHSSVQQNNGLLDRPDISEKPSSIVVLSPVETFWYLACKYYGDGTQWKRIATANGCELAYDTYVGQRVILP